MVQYLGAPTTVSVSGYAVNIYPQAQITLPSHLADTVVDTQLTGKGVRQKWISILKLNIYVAAHYMDNLADLNTAQPMSAMAKSKARIIRLTMLQNATANDIRTDFEESLDVNGVDLESDAMVSIRNQLDFSLNAGDSVTIIGYPSADGMDHFVVEAPKKIIQEQAPGLSVDFWKIWFGIPMDKEMKALQANLLGIHKP